MDEIPRQPAAAVAWLFKKLFSEQELRDWIIMSKGKDVGYALPGVGSTIATLAFGAASALERRGLLDHALFQALVRHAPSRYETIAKVAAVCGVTGLEVPDLPPETPPPPSSSTVDLLVITALKDELDALLALADDWTTEDDPEGFPFHRAQVPGANKTLTIAAAWSGSMGELAAADRATKLIDHLDPGCLAMCGICAGNKDDVGLGDVIVADRVFNYDHGKLVVTTSEDGTRQEEMFHDITTYNLEATWGVKATYLAGEPGWKEAIPLRRPVSLRYQRDWVLLTLLAQASGGVALQDHPELNAACPAWAEVIQSLEASELIRFAATIELTDTGTAAAQRMRLLHRGTVPPDAPFKAVIGPIATGSKVQQDPQLFSRLKKVGRKTVGVEMEANAIEFVASRAKIPVLVVKAVSDFGDGDKDDHFRAFACSASATYLLHFMQKNL